LLVKIVVVTKVVFGGSDCIALLIVVDSAVYRFSSVLVARMTEPLLGVPRDPSARL
jgi:hypothetical protein